MVLSLLTAAFIPLIVIGGGMYYYAYTALKQTTVESLQVRALDQKQTLDRFIDQRLASLKLIGSSLRQAASKTPDQSAGAMETMILNVGGFEEIEIVSGDGRRIAYYGPPSPSAENYHDQNWFQQTFKQGLYISDVFSDNKRAPYFIIALSQPYGDGFFIIRAATEASLLQQIINKTPSTAREFTCLLNENGGFIVRPPAMDSMERQFGAAGLSRFDGVIVEFEKESLLAKTWSEKAPWMCLVYVSKNIVFQKLHRLRNLGLLVFLIGSVLIGITVLLTTNHLVSRLEYKRRNIAAQDQQLLRLGQLNAKMQLSQRLLDKLKDVLNTIGSSADLIRDHSSSAMTASEEIGENVDLIKQELTHSQNMIQKFKAAAWPSETLVPIIMDMDLNELLDELGHLLLDDFYQDHIEVEKHFQEDLRIIHSDRSQIRLVLQDLLLFQAAAAYDIGGKMVLETRGLEDRAQIIIGLVTREGLVSQFLDHNFLGGAATLENTGLDFSFYQSILKKIGANIFIEKSSEEDYGFVLELTYKHEFKF